MKPWVLPLILLLATPASGLAQEPPARIKLQAPSALRPGEISKLVVELVGENGKPSPAPQDLQIKIEGAGGLIRTSQVTIPAGSSKAEVPIRAPKPGLWKVEASSPGLFSGFGLVPCIAPKTTPVPSTVVRRPTAAATDEPAPQMETIRRPSGTASIRTDARVLRRSAPRGSVSEPAPPPPPPAEEVRSPARRRRDVLTELEGLPVDGQPAGSPQGRVELIAQPAKLRRGSGGWEPSRVEAFWFDGEAPGQSPRDLSLSLVIEGGSGNTTLAPNLLSIPKDQFKSQEAATISARRADSAIVRALYPGGQSRPVQIDFLGSEPHRLVFAGAPPVFRGLTAVTTEVFVRLLDEDGQPVVAERPVEVDVAVQGTTGTRSYPSTVPPGAFQAKVPIELVRPGRYTVLAAAAGLAEAEPLAVRFALDWLLIASSLFGGILGSLTRVLYRREHGTKGLARTVALGVVAALFVLLLSIFGILSVLGDALPAAKPLEKVPATSVLGALLLGFVAGLTFDLVLGRFLGGTRGKRSKPSAGKPSPPAKEAPA